MKKTLFLFAFVAFFGMTSCKEDATKKVKSENVEMAQERDQSAKMVPEMTFEFSEYDFGTITKGNPVEKVFKFTNTGNAPLIITNASSSCGCTVPEYHKNEPVAPGETGEILVKYNASGVNQVTKTVTLVTNTAKGTEMIKIKAFVEPKA